MDNTVYVQSYAEMPYNRREILRYAGVRGEASELDALLDKCISELKGKLVYKVCYREFDIVRDGSELDLGFVKSESVDLKRNLLGCTGVVLFAATVGIELDRLIARYGALSPAKALLLQAIGAERVEALCDSFERDVADKKSRDGYLTHPRFSAGYGDLPLKIQSNVFLALDCYRKIGLSLNESLLMSPSKSVTAIIGVEKQ